MTATPKTSRVANSGAILVAITFAFTILYAAIPTNLMFAIILLVGFIALTVCAIAVLSCLATGQRGVGRAAIAGACIMLSALLVPAT